MGNGTFHDKSWYPYAVAACIGVAFYVLLTHWGTVTGALGTFVGYFRVVILGGVLAYLMNPLACWLERVPLRSIRREKTRWMLAVTLTVFLTLVLLVMLLGMLIPQLIRSVRIFAGNFKDYAVSLQEWLSGLGLSLSGTILDPQELGELSENAVEKLASFVSENAGGILNMAADAGRNVFSLAIALVLSVYLLLAKCAVRKGTLRFIRAVLSPKRAKGIISFFRHCDKILVSFVVDSLMESLIIGTANAAFMAVCGMQYIGLISVLVGLANLIPAFGPIISGILGAFILLLVNPLHAAVFIGFTLVLQFIDGYLVKPKLFGSALGVSGLFILIAVIVGGNMFGVLGILLSIPAAAILSDIYQDYLLPALERRRKMIK